MPRRRLNSHQRYNLRSAIMAHPHATNFVRSSDELFGLPDRELYGLAKKLGLDPSVAVNVDDVPPSFEEHAFRGRIEFDLTLTLLGEAVPRKARILYGYTPAWAYFDPDSGTEKLDSEASSMAAEILAVPDDKRYMSAPSGAFVRESNTPEWVSFAPLLEIGVLPSELTEKLLQAIDAQCRALDRERRKSIIRN